MRFIEIQDLLGRAETHERFQHFFVERTVRLRIEFPVGKRARAPFPELHVAILVENLIFKKVFVLRRALVHRAAPFQYDRENAAIDQTHCAEQPCGSRARDDRIFWRMFDF